MTILFLLLGLASGILSGLFGIGGGVIMVLGMSTLLRLPFTTATGTSLAAMILPVGILGTLEYWRHGHVHLRGALLLALGLFIGAYFGALLANGARPALVQRLFAVFLGIMAVRTWMAA